MHDDKSEGNRLVARLLPGRQHLFWVLANGPRESACPFHAGHGW